MTGQKRSRTRALATPGTDVGALRYTLFKEGHARIQAAIGAGFFLEAITLTESLIADRLESRLSFLTGSDISFLSLGPLIDLTKQHETYPEVRGLVTSDVDDWRRQRNAAAHEMLKIESGDRRSWDDRNSQLKVVAKGGYRILRTLVRAIDRLKPRRSVR
jgi:hypothetical protein